MAPMKKAFLVLAALVALAGAGFVAKVGPRNVIGMIRYDQRRDGDLKVGDRAPDAQLVALDGKSARPLFTVRDRPTVLIFGSFT